MANMPDSDFRLNQNLHDIGSQQGISGKIPDGYVLDTFKLVATITDKEPAGAKPSEVPIHQGYLVQDKDGNFVTLSPNDPPSPFGPDVRAVFKRPNDKATFAIPVQGVAAAYNCTTGAGARRAYRDVLETMVRLEGLIAQEATRPTRSPPTVVYHHGKFDEKAAEAYGRSEEVRYTIKGQTYTLWVPPAPPPPPPPEQIVQFYRPIYRPAPTPQPTEGTAPV
jgi:hypothetical protein